MSLQLGTVHFWIFDQIGLVEGRADGLVEALGEPGRQAWAQIEARHPGRFRTCDLEELLEGRSIHAGLEAMIAVVLAREAELVAWVRKREAPETWSAFSAAYEEDGSRLGRRVGYALGDDDASALFAGLRECWLLGMPCDLRMEILEQDTGRLRAVVEPLALPRYWEGSGCPVEDLLDLQGRWLRAFVRAASSAFDLDWSSGRREGGWYCDLTLIRIE